MKTKHQKFLALLLTATFLLISCSKNDDTPKENLVLEIGQEYQGGIIFYLDNSGEHGLIAYQSDLADAPWAVSLNQTQYLQPLLLPKMTASVLERKTHLPSSTFATNQIVQRD
ncbi:hypothetical protein [Aequorivita sublithincola]|uniref:hypothetical protein n=1 Tax=Aequorivita sublithincola TaxID=101385 RepID=UPI0002EFD4E7|nr:hypothetical protein [Aequorivita sublithincola]